MKNFLPALIVMLVILPQMSFAATQNTLGTTPAPTVNEPTTPVVNNTPPAAVDPGLAAFQRQQDASSLAFFQKQAADRAAFIANHKSLIAKLDQQGKAIMAYKNAQQKGVAPGTPPPAAPTSVLSSDEANVFSSFLAKQRTDGANFLQKLAQDKQQYLSSGASASPASTVTAPDTNG